MDLSPNIVSHVFSLPARERFELAQQLMESVDAKTVAECDAEFFAEIEDRRAQMLRGEETVLDWRSSLTAIEKELSSENPLENQR